MRQKGTNLRPTWAALFSPFSKTYKQNFFEMGSCCAAQDVLKFMNSTDLHNRVSFIVCELYLHIAVIENSV
jgi:hypothetical protein